MQGLFQVVEVVAAFDASEVAFCPEKGRSGSAHNHLCRMPSFNALGAVSDLSEAVFDDIGVGQHPDQFPLKV